MINKELNTLLHQCLDDKILEINLIELIESFITEKHYYFRFQDHEQGEIHQGIISKSFKRKLHRKIMHSRNDYSKKIWRNIRFHPHNQIFMHNKLCEKGIKMRCLKKHTLNNGFFLYKRKQNILDRLYYINFLSLRSKTHFVT